jgi:hypothetical protein
MKGKKLKKIARLISREVHVYPSKQNEEEFRAEYDSEVSKKFKKLVLNIIQYKENININILDDRFSISSNDINSIKTNYMPNSKYGSSSQSDDNFLELCVNNQGFYVNLGYRKRSRYTDDKIFDELLPLIRERSKEINSENFNDIWTEVMMKSGVMRDNNLDELGI